MKKLLSIALIAIVVVATAACNTITNAGDTKEPTTAVTTAVESKAEENAKPKATQAPASKKETPAVSTEFKNALKSAQTYSDVMFMSKQGIYDQLVSEYGGQFPADAAQYAVDNVDADWNKNALEKAKSYQNDMNMSKNAIYDQLISEYGEKFTESEAQYAVDHLS